MVTIPVPLGHHNTWLRQEHPNSTLGRSQPDTWLGARLSHNAHGATIQCANCNISPLSCKLWHVASTIHGEPGSAAKPTAALSLSAAKRNSAMAARTGEWMATCGRASNCRMISTSSAESGDIAVELHMHRPTDPRLSDCHPWR
eukprot:3775795-Amphidinium_carterae.2